MENLIKSFVEKLTENEVKLTTDPKEAIYILPDGQMVDGEFDMGMRGVDHRVIECAIDSSRDDKEFWNEVHEKYQLVRLVPETDTALISTTQQLTSKQKEIIDSLGYEIERY